MRVFSFCQESQRYCNYNKDKFDNSVTFIRPCWMDIPTGEYTRWEDCWVDSKTQNVLLHDTNESNVTNRFLWLLDDTDVTYRALTGQGWTAQQARAILPNATKTELYMCGFDDDWEKFLKLRNNENADPMMQEVAKRIQEELTNN